MWKDLPEEERQKIHSYYMQFISIRDEEISILTRKIINLEVKLKKLKYNLSIRGRQEDLDGLEKR